MTMSLARSAAFLLAGSAALPVLAQSPYLVKDIDTAVAVGSVGKPKELTPTAAALYALADAPTGRGLVSIDPSGTPTLVRQVPDLPTAEVGRVMTSVGETVFFTAQGGLWRSDGTAAGTTTVKQFAWPSAGVIGPGAHIANVNGVVFFWVATGAVPELWKSDGTPAGTVRVATVFAGPFVPAGNRLFFVGAGDGLWTSDGTEAGTVRLGTVVVADVLGKMVAYGNDVLFIGHTGGLGADLWRSDGTQAGTVRVKTFAPSLPHSLTRFGSVALLAASAPDGIWKTDGTEAGTTLVKDGVGVRNIYDANGVAYIHGQSAATGREVWTSDGTSAGTVVLDYCPGPCNFLNPLNTDFGAVPGGVVFTRLGSGDLWYTDGTASGIAPLGQLSVCGKGNPLDALVPFASHVYFSGCAAGREEMYRTDGTTAGTVKLTMGVDGASSSPSFAGEAGDNAIFAATRPDVGREIWRTAGTEPSTQLLADLSPGPTGAEWYGVASLGELFTFTTVVSNGIDYLSSTDGSPAGTRAIGGGADRTRRAAVRDGLAVYVNSGGVPVRTDGTPEGTFAVPPPASAMPGIGAAVGSETLASHAGRFVMSMGQLSYLDGPQLWFTVDGNEPTTRFGLPVACPAVTSVEDRLFLACDAGTFENDLWISDGTYSGTSMLADLPGQLLPGSVGLDGKLFFRVAGPSGSSLWFSDGTPSGTAALSSIATAPTDAKGLTVSGGVLYFAGFTFESGSELWRTDGTAAGTFMIRDFDTGPASGLTADFESDSAIAPMSGGVVFTATTGTRGAELWFSDGTSAGTIPLAEIAPGPASSSPGSFRRAGDRVYFAADDGIHGREPWAIQLTAPSVSVGDATVTEGDTGSTTASFAVHLDLPPGTVVTVPYTTAAGSASAGVDFVPVSGTLTFGPGARDLSVDVAIQGDVSDETDESFALVLTSAAGAAIADGHGAGVILDDDQPSVAVAGASVLEGDSGVTNASFPVTVTTEDGQPTAHVVALRGDVVPGTASPPDFPPYNPGVWPTVSFPAGTPSGSTLPMLVPVQGDTLDEPNETYQLRVEGQHDAVVTAPAAGVILDDDGVNAAAPVELAHGSTIVADLQPRPGQSEDVDFYVMQLDPASSHELVADGVSGDVAPIVVERVAADGSVVQTATPLGSGSAVSMRGFSSVAGGHIRVRGACAGACGADDTYRLRLYNTTLALPRVNNSGSQTTVLILQNLTSSTVNASVARWTGAGELAPLGAVTSHTIAPHGTAVVETDTSPGAAFTGSITVASDAPYGGLAGKAASIDPASGFSFDTPLRYRPR